MRIEPGLAAGPRLVAPRQLIRGRGALAASLDALVALGRRPLLAVGQRRAGNVAGYLHDELNRTGMTVATIEHRGPCCTDAMAHIVRAARDVRADVIVGIGGGRVLDTSKASADDLDLPFAAVPTSPATCAAATPVAVIYTPEGRYLRTRATQRAPDVAVLDTTLLADAPDRLLIAGVLDALAKVHEVRRTSGEAGRVSATARAALALCDDLEAAIDRHVAAAIASDGTQNAAPRLARELLAEASVLTPGLIGGLAGADAKFAVAHPLHNALTALAGSHAALHGELVAFGVLVQMALAGGSEDAVRGEARRYAQWGVRCHLVALGCGEARSEATASVVDATVGTLEVRAAFPNADASDFAAAMLQVDGWAREEADAVLGPAAR